MEKNCNTCRYSYAVAAMLIDGKWKPCWEDCTGYSYWQPREKPMYVTSNLDGVRSTPNPKKKETKMWKKLRKRGRRITMAWDLFGLFLLCKLVNPWIYKFWHLALPTMYDGNEGSFDYKIGDCAGHWILTIASIAAILSALYGLDRLAAWWYGEEK